MTDTINYKAVFDLHCYHENGRPALQKPFKRDGYYFATDGHSLLYLNQSEMDLDFFIERADTPDCLAVIPTKRTDPVTIDCDKLNKLIQEKAPKIKEQKECFQCDGEGGEECNLGHWHDCEYCDGKGSYDREDGKLIPDESAVFVFDGVALKIKMLQKLILTAKALGRNDVLWVYRENQKASLFQMYPFMLLIMTCVNPPVVDGDEYVNIDLSEII